MALYIGPTGSTVAGEATIFCWSGGGYLDWWYRSYFNGVLAGQLIEPASTPLHWNSVGPSIYKLGAVPNTAYNIDVYYNIGPDRVNYWELLDYGDDPHPVNITTRGVGLTVDDEYLYPANGATEILKGELILTYYVPSSLAASVEHTIVRYKKSTNAEWTEVHDDGINEKVTITVEPGVTYQWQVVNYGLSLGCDDPYNENWSATSEIFTFTVAGVPVYPHTIGKKDGAPADLYIDDELVAENVTEYEFEAEYGKDYTYRWGEDVSIPGKSQSHFVDCDIKTGADTGSWNDTQIRTIWYPSDHSHLENEIVSILADGAVHPDRTVTNGEVVLDYDADVKHIGLHYHSKLQPMKLDGEVYNKRIRKLILLLNETLGGQFGETEDDLDTITFRTNEMDDSPDLFTGHKELSFDGSYNRQGDLWVEQYQPLPMKLIGIIAEMDEYDD